MTAFEVLGQILKRKQLLGIGRTLKKSINQEFYLDCLNTIEIPYHTEKFVWKTYLAKYPAHQIHIFQK